jgi:type I site-specific restriction endonuclease
MNEAETRKRLIDRQMEAAGWRLNDRTQMEGWR